MKNVEGYSCFDSAGSDHPVVTKEIRLSLRLTKLPADRDCIDWKPILTSSSGTDSKHFTGKMKLLQTNTTPQ